MSEKQHLRALPEQYAKLLELAQDISQEVLVPWPEEITGELVNRRPSWDVSEKIHPVKAADRIRIKDCPLCAFASDDSKQHGRLWEAYAGEEKNLDQVVAQAQDMGIAGINPGLAKKHFQNHSYEQPAPQGRVSDEDRIQSIHQIPDRKQRIPVILVALYRHRFLSRRQIVQLLIPGSDVRQSDDKNISRLLNRLRFKHAVYEFYREGEKGKKYYALGMYGATLVEQLEGVLIGKTGVAKRSQISDMKMAHDIPASDVYIQMRCQLADMENQMTVAGHPAGVDMPPQSWWGERNLSMAFRVPGGEQKVEPDGLATLAVNDGRHLQVQLPFWIEWDSGFKRERTIQQIINYIGFLRSPAPGQRFPQLSADGYGVPLLMITNKPERAAELCEAVAIGAKQQNMDLAAAPLMLITDQQTMENGTWKPGAWRDIRTGQVLEKTLADLLLEASKPLLDAKPIHLRDAIQIDPDGARPSTNLGTH